MYFCLPLSTLSRHFLFFIAEQHVVILTPTFQNLLRLEEDDQDTWMVERIEDLFEEAECISISASTGTGTDVGSYGSNPIISGLRRSRSAIDELLLLCEDCELELGSRNPRVGVHCKAYVQRFALAVKARCLLELQSMLMVDYWGNNDEEEDLSSVGTGAECLCRRLATLGTQSLCEAISLMGRVERCKRYHFMPHAYVQSLHTNLFSIGELISAYLNLAIERTEIWFQNTLALAPQQRGQRFSEFIQVVLSQILKGASLDARDATLQAHLLQKLAVSTMLTFSDQLSILNFTSWEQQCTLDFIASMQSMLRDLENGIVTWEWEGYQGENDSRSRSTSGNINVGGSGSGQWSPATSQHFQQQQYQHQYRSLPIPTHAAEAVRSACIEIAFKATNNIADSFELSLHIFSDPLFEQKIKENWQGDQACSLLISHINSWGTHLRNSLPLFLSKFIRRRCVRMIIMIYIGRIAYLYKILHSHGLGNSIGLGISQYASSFTSSSSSSSSYGHGLSFDSTAIFQVQRDISSLLRYAESESSEEVHIMREVDMLQHIRCAFTISIDTTSPAKFVSVFWPAVVSFGLVYGPHLYDLYRLVLKARADVSDKTRKFALGSCAAFLTALENATTAEQSLFEAWEGGTNMNLPVHGQGVSLINCTANGGQTVTHILQLLCPKVGIEHCTGSKWGVERHPEDTTTRSLIQQYVSIAIEKARCVKEERQAIEKKVMLANRATIKRAQDVRQLAAQDAQVAMEKTFQIEVANAEAADRKSIRRVLRQRSGDVYDSSNDGSATATGTGTYISESGLKTGSVKHGGIGGDEVSTLNSNNNFNLYAGFTPLYPPPAAPLHTPQSTPAAEVVAAVPVPVVVVAPVVVARKNKIVHRRTDDGSSNTISPTPSVAGQGSTFSSLPSFSSSVPIASVSTKLQRQEEEDEEDEEYELDFEDEDEDEEVQRETETEIVEECAQEHATQMVQKSHYDTITAAIPVVAVPVSKWIRRTNSTNGRHYWQNTCTNEKTFTDPYLSVSIPSSTTVIETTAVECTSLKTSAATATTTSACDNSDLKINMHVLVPKGRVSVRRGLPTATDTGSSTGCGDISSNSNSSSDIVGMLATTNATATTASDTTAAGRRAPPPPPADRRRPNPPKTETDPGVEAENGDNNTQESPLSAPAVAIAATKQQVTQTHDDTMLEVDVEASVTNATANAIATVSTTTSASTRPPPKPVRKPQMRFQGLSSTFPLPATTTTTTTTAAATTTTSISPLGDTDKETSHMLNSIAATAATDSGDSFSSSSSGHRDPILSAQRNEDFRLLLLSAQRNLAEARLRDEQQQQDEE